MIKVYRPRKKYLIKDFIFYLLIIFLVGLFSGLLPVWFVVGVVTIFLVLGIYLLIYFSMMWYEVDEVEKEVRKNYGVIQLNRDTIPYNSITNLNIKRSVYGRLLGLATIYIETAGTPLTEMVWEAVDIHDANEIEEMI